MNDHSELKKLAESTKGWDNLKSCWPEETEDGDLEVNWFVGGVSDDDERYPVVEVNTAQYDAIEDAGHLARFYAAANPAAMLALIAEAEGLHAQHGRDSAELRSLCQARDDARKERDQLKAKIEALRKDADRYRWLRKHNWFDSDIAVVRSPNESIKIGYDCPSTERLDDYIDNEMKESKS